MDAFQQTLSILSERGLECFTHDNFNHILFGGTSFTNKKIIVAKDKELHFVAYDFYGSRAGTTDTFCGVYFPFPLDAKAELSVYFKNCLDVFFRKNRKKTGIKDVDHSFTYISSSAEIPPAFQHSEVLNQFSQFRQHKLPARLLLANNPLPWVTPLKGVWVAGIEINDWIFDKEKINLMFECAKILHQKSIK